MDVRRWVMVTLCVTMGMAMAPMSHAQETGGTASVSVNAGGGSTPPILPSCPIEYLGELNGMYIYLTSDCANVTGYGSSADLIPVPQCQPGGMCGQPIAGHSVSVGNYVLVSLLAQDAKVADVPAWIKELNGQKAVVQKGINGRTSGDTRRENLSSLLRTIDDALVRLNSSDPVEAKTQVYNAYRATMDNYTKSFRFVGLAPPNDQKFGVRDVPSKQVLKTAAETNYSTANVDATRVQVTATKTKVLRVELAPRQFVYFQCFDVRVGMPNKPGLVTLKLGMQVKADGLVNPEVAQFSERGNYAHRLRDAGNNPYLVNSIDSLEPK